MKTKYENSLFYQINSCAGYFNLLFNQFFKELNIEISAVEHLALSVISQTQQCCQRDLARIILKDRANTGKLVGNLEKKGLLKIELKTKNKRPVKILTLTEKGENVCQSVNNIIQPYISKIRNEISDEEINKTIDMLCKFKEVVEKSVQVNI